jgi:long-chain fatty acid transport protein
MTRAQELAGTLFLTVALASSAIAGGFQLNEHGASAMAQGGAFVARASDGSAIYFNPAGLAFQNGTSIMAGATLITPSTTFQGPAQIDPNQKTDLVSATFTPINVYATTKVNDQLAIGIGLNNPYGLGTEWPEDWQGKFLTTKVDLKTFFLTPTLAYRVSDQLSVGAGFSYVVGSVLLQRAVAVTSVDLPAPPRASISLNGSGLGYSLGAMYRFSKDFSVGASYRSEVQIDATGNVSFTPDYAVLRLPTGGVTSSLSLPATGFVGVAFSPIEDVQLEADYQYIGWSSYNELAVTFTSNSSRTVSPKNYKDTYMLRVGGEYTMDNIHLRAGYVYDHSPVQTQYVEPLLPDASRNDFSVGAGYDVDNHLTVDGTVMYIKFQQRTALNTIPEISFDGTYNTTVVLIALNVVYHF